MQTSSPLARIVRSAIRVLELTGAVLLFAMMLLTFVDVIGRYVFNSPVPGGFEVTELMLAMLVYCGLPLICFRDGHVTVDLAEAVLPSFAKRVRDAIICVSVSVILVFLGLWLWNKAGDFQRYNDVSAMLLIPLAPVVYVMAVSCFVSAVLSLLRLIPGVSQKSSSLISGAD